MAGHSHWAGIKHKKEITDKKRGQVFSKLLAAVTAAAKTEPNQDFNPRLRTAIEKARREGVPRESIDRAVRRASEGGEELDELLFEAYGPSGAALLIEAIADNRNRVVAEVKKILADYGAKWAETGSVRWAFETAEGAWKPKFPQTVSEGEKTKLEELLSALLAHDDVQSIATNIVGFENRRAD